MTQRPGARALPAWQLNAFAIDRLHPDEDVVDQPTPSPAAVFEAEARAIADRIRAEVAAAVCQCQMPADVVDGRCSRCWSRRR